MSEEWFTAAELAALRLPALPTAVPNLRAYLARNGALDAAEGRLWRQRAGKGGGVEYHLSALPVEAQAALRLQEKPVKAAEPRLTAKASITRDGLWNWYERLPAKKKAAAQLRATALDAVAAMVRGGEDKTVAIALVATQTGVSKSTLWNWENAVLGVPRGDWLPRLAPRHSGAAERRECPAEAWDMLRADYLRPERPTFEACFRRLQAVAAVKGWELPSGQTLRRRLEALPDAIRVLARQGDEALKALYPAQQRTRGHFHALEAINVDGHKWDVFVKWPDGVVRRPMMVAFQDLYSGKLLSWRIDWSENKEATRLALGDLIDEFGIPDKCWLDNGKAFASKWITGGSPNRYRFKVRDEDPQGLLTSLGVQIHWTKPYSGQSKPIERMFGDFAGDIAKHPRFAGAYVGNNPTAKPENYGSKAVPLDVFIATVAAEVAAHNARPGRRSEVCNGRSLDAAFAESYAAAPIRRATGPQRRMFLLMAEALRCDSRDGSLRLEGNRFWAEFLTGLRGQKITARFDPQDLKQPLAIYALDGRFLGEAGCIDAVGFDDVEAGRAHERNRNAYKRGVRMQAEAERRMTIQQVAALLPAPDAAAPAPDRKIVRPVFGNTALKPRELPEQSEGEVLLLKGLRLVHGPDLGG